MGIGIIPYLRAPIRDIYFFTIPKSPPKDVPKVLGHIVDDNWALQPEIK